MDQPLTGCEIVGPDGDHIGKVSDVISDVQTEEPAYVLVDFGMLKKHHVLVPLQQSHRTPEGSLVVPFDKEKVKHAPNVDTPVALTKQLEDQVHDYYGVSHN